MSMKRQKQLLDSLVRQSNQWVSAQELSDLLNVSTRQVRKYIADINDECGDFRLIKSGKKGYHLDGDQYLNYKKKADNTSMDIPQSRQIYIIHKLISSVTGYEIFDFSDELFVSVPTIENDLKPVRKTLERYGLKLKRNKDIISVEGDEPAKRTIMRNVILPDSFDHFIFKDEIQLLTFHYRFWDLRKNIQEILSKGNEIFTNDYTLNNIALHVIVMIDRIRNGGELKQDKLAQFHQLPVQYSAASNIAAYISRIYDIKLNEAEIYNLMITILNNSTVVDFNTVELSTLGQYIDQDYITLSKKVLKKVERVYYLDPFNDDLIARFVIHVNNLFSRLESGYQARNPIKEKMKNAFPLIYDIAVFIAQEFKKECGIHMSEDEIAYIALHIGGYFENSLNNRNKANCAFIYADYYDGYKRDIEKISRVFADVLTVKYIVPLSQYNSETIQADFIISSAELNTDKRHIVINPFLNDSDMEQIRLAVKHILRKNRISALKAYLFNFIDAGLFYKNPDFADKDTAITAMTQKVIQLGYANSNLTKNVFQREALSDTAFSGIAVPHSLQDDAIKSFISFAISDRQISWGKENVNIIMLIGVSSDSRKVFTEVYDTLIDILSETKNVKELVASADYKEFYHRLISQTEALTDQ